MIEIERREFLRKSAVASVSGAVLILYPEVMTDVTNTIFDHSLRFIGLTAFAIASVNNRKGLSNENYTHPANLISFSAMFIGFNHFLSSKTAEEIGYVASELLKVIVK